MRMRARQRPAEVVIRSASPTLLGLPWELMRDPDRQAPLVLDLAGLSRSLPVGNLETLPVPGGRLRVLMVISRPAGMADVGYRVVSRPLLERLEAVRGEVELVVLRPPTLDALREALAAAVAAGEPFHVVHFDGHGMLPGREVGRADSGGRSVTLSGPGEEGMLEFENPWGGRDDIPASKVAAVLRDGQVPVVVLNACQSGAVGKDLEAAVATRLLGDGCAAVVAMAYSVYAVAAAEFMAVFYERLFAGDTVTKAVTAGRKRLFEHDGRPSPKGDLPLADWMVPVHYLRRDVSFPQAHTSRPAAQPSLEVVLDELRAPSPNQASGTGALDPAAGVFVGRDDLFYQLEAAARLQRVVLLCGPGGTGKTELAKAFGRWWRDTGGVEQPEWVFWHSFEPGTASFGLDGVISQIGLRLFGLEFAHLGSVERRAVVEKVLAERRMLLVWDNFETIRSMPDPVAATGPLSEEGCRDLREFLGRLAERGRSAALITSRTSEDWLGGIRRISVGGLVPAEAIEYAAELLAPYPAAAPRRVWPVFGELIKWLDGHPLSMRLILPRLDTTDPAVLLDELRGTAQWADDDDTQGGRITSLAASISYSFAHLAEATRRLLPAVCLLHGVADANLLAAFSEVSPARFSWAKKQDWQQALEDAARVGLLTRLSTAMYQMHPALPAYLARQWRREETEGHDALRDATTRALLVACAVFSGVLYEQIESGDAGLAYTIIGLYRHTLGSMLGYALGRRLWAEAQAIAQALGEYWKVQGLDDEAAAWSDRVCLATERPDGTPPKLDSTAGGLWLYFTGFQTNQLTEGLRLDDAEKTLHKILALLQAQPLSIRQQQEEQLATTYHQLGNVAHMRGRVDDASDWHRKSLALRVELGDRPGIAASYHQLGMIAQDQGRLDGAEDWYLKSLAIEEELGDRPRMADSYHQLGNLARDRGRQEDAEDWYRKSLALRVELGDRHGMADSYHQLGMIAQHQGRLDGAEDWYLKSLAIEEELGDRPRMAASYHQFGNLARERGQLEDAEGWHRKSLALRVELGDRHGMADSYHQLGNRACDRGQLEDAEDYPPPARISQEADQPRPQVISSKHHDSSSPGPDTNPAESRRSHHRHSPRPSRNPSFTVRAPQGSGIRARPGPASFRQRRSR
jgi:tetratricopeptide (TPR) repeat protein